MSAPLAHTDNHLLVTHLHAVANSAQAFAKNIDPNGQTENWAYLAGLWHDLGKYRPGFQRYLHQSGNSDAHIEGKVSGREKTHSAGEVDVLDYVSLFLTLCAAHELVILVRGEEGFPP